MPLDPARLDRVRTQLLAMVAMTALSCTEKPPPPDAAAPSAPAPDVEAGVAALPAEGTAVPSPRDAGAAPPADSAGVPPPRDAGAAPPADSAGVPPPRDAGAAPPRPPNPRRNPRFHIQIVREL
jgi:hypothetical protein